MKVEAQERRASLADLHLPSRNSSVIDRVAQHRACLLSTLLAQATMRILKLMPSHLV